MKKTKEELADLLQLLDNWGCLDNLTPNERATIKKLVWNIPNVAKQDIINQINQQQ
jgi:hypothetical protein